MRQYAVITNLESPKADRYTMSSLPLHVTILSIFFSEEEPQLFSRFLKSAAEMSRSFTAKTTGRAQFGLNRDIPVTLVEKSPELANLHLQLLGLVTDHVSFRAPQFVGEKFGPHVTDQNERRISLNSTIVIDNLTLVEIIDEDVQVRAFYDLLPAT